MVDISTGQLIQMGMERSAAESLARRLSQLPGTLSEMECWKRISNEILGPEHPFSVHQYVFETVCATWDDSQSPPPAWIPSHDLIESANVTGLMKELGLPTYDDLHTWSVENYVEFWSRMIRTLGILFKTDYSALVDLSGGVESPRWLPGAAINIAESCFLTAGSQQAIVYQKEEGPLQAITYKELEQLTNRVAHSLIALGFQPGEAIAIDMPMTVESVAIYLGIIKAGCVVVSIADSFAPHEIETRLRLGKAVGIFTQDQMARSGKALPLYEKVVSIDAPRAIVLPSGTDSSLELRPGDMHWNEFLGDKDRFDSIACDPNAPTNILFSSGTTGDPKVIPWTHTTPIKCAVDGYLHHNIQPGDRLAWPTNLGWMMGPWLIYASLMNQGSMALYYGVPSGRSFGEFVQNAKVNMLGVVPSLVRTWKSTGCMHGLDWTRIKAFSSTGECSNTEDMLFLMSLAGYRPVIEYCGGTEIGGGYITGTVVKPSAPGTFSTPALGLDFLMVDEEGQSVDNGEVMLSSPSIGLSTELLNQDHNEVYFRGTPKVPGKGVLRRHGDQIERLPGGYYRAHGRVDDTMNLAGIKVSSAEVERVVGTVAHVSETAAIAVRSDSGGPNQLIIYAVLSRGAETTREALMAEMQKQIKQNLNPLFKIHEVIIVNTLPRTASNKILRRQLRAQYEGPEKQAQG